MSPQNRAAWLMKKQDKAFIVKDAPYNKPEADELVIKTTAVAINPADLAIQKLGIIIDAYPAILGCDAAGIVQEVGFDITDFKPGDRVIGPTRPLPGGIYKYSGFQQYVVLKMPLVAKIPDTATFTDAVVLPLGINTAAACLFHETTLALDMPPPPPSSGQGEGGGGGKGKTLLIWGASSSVGSCGVQLAAAAGYEVFGVASAKNHAFVTSIGAAQAFDQNDPNFIENLVAALKNKDCVGAYDAISKEETLHAICDVLYRSGGKKLIAAVKPGAERLAKQDVVIKTNFSCRDFEDSVGRHIWRGFLEPALAEGGLRYGPPADVVGQGLEDVQEGCDVLARGVSARKVVVAL